MHPWNENKIENMEKQRTYPLIISSSTWRAHIYPESNDMMRVPHRWPFFLWLDSTCHFITLYTFAI